MRKAFSLAISFLLWFVMMRFWTDCVTHCLWQTEETQLWVSASRMVSVQCQLDRLDRYLALGPARNVWEAVILQCVLIKFIFVGKPIFSVGRIIPWVGILYCMKWRRPAECEHSLLSASCLWMGPVRLLQALVVVTFLPYWTIPDCEPKKTPSSRSCIHQSILS